jgi:hypothetical protein
MKPDPHRRREVQGGSRSCVFSFAPRAARSRHRNLSRNKHRAGAALAEVKGSPMRADNEAKIRRWEQYIEESRKEAKLLSPEGQRELQTVIHSYEKLIAMTREHDKNG